MRRSSLTVSVGSSSRDLPLIGTFTRGSTAAASPAVPPARPKDDLATSLLKTTATIADVAECAQSYMTANGNGLLSFGGTTGLFSTQAVVPCPADAPRGPER